MPVIHDIQVIHIMWDLSGTQVMQAMQIKFLKNVEEGSVIKSVGVIT